MTMVAVRRKVAPEDWSRVADARLGWALPIIADRWGRLLADEVAVHVLDVIEGREPTPDVSYPQF